jgi:hypothetical protein
LGLTDLNGGALFNAEFGIRHRGNTVPERSGVALSFCGRPTIQAELANDLAAQYQVFSQRASDLANSASAVGAGVQSSAQKALNSASIIFQQQADSLRLQGISALKDVDASLLSSAGHSLLAKAGDVLGPVGDILDIGLKAVDGNYYGAAGAFVGAVAGAALAALLIGTAGIIAIPAIALFGWGVGAFAEKVFNLLDPLGINSNVNTDFDLARNFLQQRYDPLALDLDSDGIETISADTGITFDFDGDGLKTGTGWVKGDDGLLVLDRNSNGSIDTGKELFGVDTIKSVTVRSAPTPDGHLDQPR